MRTAPAAERMHAMLTVGTTCTKVTNKRGDWNHFGACYSRIALDVRCSRDWVAAQKENFRRLLRTVETLSDLGPEITAEREFAQTAHTMLSALMHASAAREGVLFVLIEKPSMLSSIAA